MKKALSFILALCMLCSSCTALAGGFLPSINQVYGVDMPSLSYVLQRLPDSTEELPDGGSKVTYMNVTEADYDAFSTYLGDYGCTLLDYAEGDNGLCFTLEKEGCSFTFEYSNLSGIAVLTYPAGCTEDLTWAQDLYNDAMTALEEKDYLAATAALEQIKGYKDADSILVDCENEIAAATAAAAREAKLKQCKTVGNYVTYGTYPQTAAGNDNTPIEWLVLEYDAKNNKALLISRYGLDCQKYNSSKTSVTWETCSLRTWLNGTFLNKAFSKAEQEAILTTNVDNSKSQCSSRWSTSGGNNTQDKIFLLSYAEANKYFKVTWEDSNNTKSRVAPTAYAIAQGAYTSSSSKTADGLASGYWWLRSPGDNPVHAARVLSDGSLSSPSVDSNTLLVRPAFWLDLSGI